jgi:hypothetical protein
VPEQNTFCMRKLYTVSGTHSLFMRFVHDKSSVWTYTFCVEDMCILCVKDMCILCVEDMRIENIVSGHIHFAHFCVRGRYVLSGGYTLLECFFVLRDVGKSFLRQTA